MRILAIIPTLKDDPLETIGSIQRQTVGDIDICVISGCLGKRFTDVQWFYFKPNMCESVGLRVARSINYALSFYCLPRYEYLLRVDADVIIPRDFIKDNVKLDSSYVGKAGYAMLIKMVDFLKVFDGRFPLVGAEDSYISFMFESKGYSNLTWNTHPIVTREGFKRHPWRYHYARGLEMFKLGYEPVHVIHASRNSFLIVGYLRGLFSMVDRYPFYKWVFRHQVRRIIYRKARPEQVSQMITHKRKNTLLNLVVVYLVMAGLIVGVGIFYWLLHLAGLIE